MANVWLDFVTRIVDETIKIYVWKSDGRKMRARRSVLMYAAQHSLVIELYCEKKL